MMHSVYSSFCWVLLLALTGCAHLQAKPDLPMETAAPVSDTTALDQLIAGAEAKHPSQSGFRLLVKGEQAFAMRIGSARLASRTLDVQTYIWHADPTGLYIAFTLLEAADRGVKVRILLDDMDARAKNAGLAALAAHPNIVVRLFNPFASREGTLRFIGEAVTSFGRIN